MVEGAEAEEKKNTDVEVLSSLEIQITFFGFVLICWHLLIFTLITFPLLFPLPARYHLISELFTDVCAR